MVLNCSNTCRQLSHQRIERHGVGPKMFSSRVSVELQYGQRKVFDCSCTSVVAPAERGAGGGRPAARSFSRPAALMRSVDHESSWITATAGSAPSSETFSSS